jgi:hypothetical protein
MADKKRKAPERDTTKHPLATSLYSSQPSKRFKHNEP